MRWSPVLHRLVRSGHLRFPLADVSRGRQLRGPVQVSAHRHRALRHPGVHRSVHRLPRRLFQRLLLLAGQLCHSVHGGDHLRHVRRELLALFHRAPLHELRQLLFHHLGKRLFQLGTCQISLSLRGGDAKQQQDGQDTPHFSAPPDSSLLK